MFDLHATYIGGPTVLLEIGGSRLLTDPTFDAAGGDYATPTYTLHKTLGPALELDRLGAIDAVLLSHDHHFDNLDRSGRALLERVARTFTTRAGAVRLGGRAQGLEAWESVDLPTALGARLRLSATPARHGPVDGDRGPVIGFTLAMPEHSTRAVYLSGDTVWHDGVAQVAQRFDVAVAFLFCGAARVAAAGPSHLTFTAKEAVEAARALGSATIVPLHFEGWAHFSESRAELEREFAAAGLDHRLQWLAPGARVRLPWSA